eukprot:1770935-Pleurochrysis_carterae.AAC.1
MRPRERAHLHAFAPFMLLAFASLRPLLQLCRVVAEPRAPPFLQVQEYACLYTSRVTNLVHCAPDVTFHALSDEMPHDRALGYGAAAKKERQ